MGDIGAPELIIILAVLLLLFGGAKLPQLARSLGQAKNEFHKAQADEGQAEPKPTATPPVALETKPIADDTVTLTRAEYEQLTKLTPPPDAGIS